MPAAPVQVGLVGYGKGGRVFHAPLIATAAGCAFAGVVTRSPERRVQLARDHPGVPAYDDLAALRAAGAEAVAVSTPYTTHVPLVREALELGMAVVCDKPFAPDAAAAREVVELAEARGLALSPYQNRRWDSDVLTVRRLLDEGALGQITRLESRFERWKPEPGPGLAGGGALLDLGSHLVDQALLLCGPVQDVYAQWHLQDSPPGLDDDLLVALTHAGGARSLLQASWRQGAPGPRLRVAGTVATYVVDGLDGQEAALVAGARPGPGWGEEPEQSWGRLQRGEDSRVVPSERGGWDGFYPAFAAAVRGEGPLPVPARDAVATAVVLAGARRSATTGEVVHL